MILFWLICAGLVAIALAFVLPPLLLGGSQGLSAVDKQQANLDIYRDQLSELEADLRNGIVGPEQYQQDRDEIERRLLEDVAPPDETGEQLRKQPANRGPVYALAFALPVLAVTLYLLVGNRAGLSPVAAPPAPFANAAGNGEMSQQQIEANVARLASRLEQQPGDAEGWIMLARSYMGLQKYSEAAAAFGKASALKKDDADLLGDYAFALAMANGRQLQGEPFELLKKALQVDPQNLKVLELAGSAEFQAKNYQQAIAYWENVLARSPPGSELARTLTENINEAKTLGAGAGDQGKN
jgi:cytochrome c-type biogenesis protein CcmH